MFSRSGGAPRFGRSPGQGSASPAHLGLVVVPAGRRSFVLTTAVRGGATATAREAGEIVLSFDA